MPLTLTVALSFLAHDESIGVAPTPAAVEEPKITIVGTALGDELVDEPDVTGLRATLLQPEKMNKPSNNWRKNFFICHCSQQENKIITSSFVVASKQVKAKKNGEPYLALILADRT